jgi:uncharacterized protein (TIGR02145 family)
MKNTHIYLPTALFTLITCEKENPGASEITIFEKEGNVDVKGGLIHITDPKSSLQGVCPTGWHLPSDAEWTTRSNVLGGDNISGGKLKEIGTSHWFHPNFGATNSSGFSALPGGYRDSEHLNIFVGLTGYGFWWSTTESTPEESVVR